MTSFADEVASDIKAAPAFWEDIARLQAVGIMSTLGSARNSQVGGPALNEDAFVRLLNSAGVLASASDEESKELAQQIAVFSALALNEPHVGDAAAHVLAGLGNFPGLHKLEKLWKSDSLNTYLRTGLLAAINSVEIAGRQLPLTNFQLEVWDNLRRPGALAISAPTSAGKSFLVLEHLCEAAAALPVFNALYIAPTRALLHEVHAKLEKRLSPIAAHVRITTIPLTDQSDRPKQIYVLTQERAQLLLSATQISFDLVVVDEAQAIGDQSRGMILQDVLEQLRRTNAGTRFLFLAPGADGFSLLDDAVGLEGLTVRETGLSPVVQNRISVSFASADEHVVNLKLVTATGFQPIGSFAFARGFALSADGRLAATALEFGATGSSLVYATGPKNAEDLAALIASNQPAKQSDRLNELAQFVRQNIHKQYSLADLVVRGVGFHYGSMPSLLRENIEAAFREGGIDYLCCTTTLFQGVNLPARNVFIDTPTRGRGDPLDEAALWNFAGRAGRLGEEVVGNVFLLEYEKWEAAPLTVRRPFPLRIAFREALAHGYEEVSSLLRESAHKEEISDSRYTDTTTAAAGLILLRASQGSLDSLLDRQQDLLSLDQRDRLKGEARAVLDSLAIPASVLASSWMISPLALTSLLHRFRKGIKAGKIDELMPVNPATDSYGVYNSIVRRLYKYLGRVSLSGDQGKRFRSYLNHVTTTAVKWMRGEPLSQLVAESVRFRVSTRATNARGSEQAVIDTAIRAMFSLVENDIRFQLVQWGKAYVDLLRFALAEAGRPADASRVYDFSLALELGVSTTTGRSLMELGLSRISASAIAPHITDSSLTPDAVRAWFGGAPEPLLRLSPLILEELRARGLIEATAV